jgi:hypothetical protein
MIGLMEEGGEEVKESEKLQAAENALVWIIRHMKNHENGNGKSLKIALGPLKLDGLSFRHFLILIMLGVVIYLFVDRHAMDFVEAGQQMMPARVERAVEGEPE